MAWEPGSAPAAGLVAAERGLCLALSGGQHACCTLRHSHLKEFHNTTVFVARLFLGASGHLDCLHVHQYTAQQNL